MNSKYNYNNFTGQYREDYYIWDWFVTNKVTPNRFLIDIGCGDGRHHSNSFYFLYNEGFSGMLIDGNKEQLDKCSSLYSDRKDITTHHALLADKRFNGSLSGGTGWSTQSLSKDKNGMQTNLVTDFINSNTRPADIVSIDIEGYSLPIMQDILLIGYTPTFIIVEANDDVEINRAMEISREYGYELSTRLDVNLIFKKD